jgi:hypothetical protein
MDDSVGKRRVQWLKRDVLLACEEAQERPALARDVVADRSAEHRVRRFQRIEHGGNRRRRGHVQRNFVSGDAGQRAEMGGEFDADDGHVCVPAVTNKVTAFRMRADKNRPYTINL